MEHILLIEDNLSDIALIQSYLRDASLTHRLHKAKSLQEGLDTIRHNPIDIALLDLSLDDSAGFNTLRMFLQEVPNIPVIVLTGTNSEVLGMQIVRAGAQDYLVKGNFDGKQLTRAIRHSTKRFKAQVELREALWQAQRREKRYQHLQELVKLGSWELDLLDNSMTWSNETFQLLGYRPNSLEPKLSDYLRIVYREDQDNVKAFFQEVIRQSKSMQIQHRVIINNRVMQYFCLSAQVISEEHNNKVILIGSVQDITELKSVETKSLPVSAAKKSFPEIHLKTTYKLRQLIDQLSQLINNMQVGISLLHKENITDAKEIISILLALIYEQANMHLVAIPSVPARKEIVNLPEWKDRMINMLETNTINTRTTPNVYWKNTLPDQAITDEQLLSLLFYNLIQNNAHLNDDKETLRIGVEVEKKEKEDVRLHFTINAPELPLSISRRKEWVGLLKELLEKNPVIKTDETTSKSLIALAKTLHALKAEVNISKKLEINIFVPLEPVEEEEEIISRPVKMLIIVHQTIVQIALKRILQAGLPQISMDFADDIDKGIQQLSQKDYDLVLVDNQLLTPEPASILNALKEIKEVTLMVLASEFSPKDEIKLRDLGVEAFVIKPPQREALLHSVYSLLFA